MFLTTSLRLRHWYCGQAQERPSASKDTLKDTGKIEHYLTTTTSTKPEMVCISLGIIGHMNIHGIFLTSYQIHDVISFCENLFRFKMLYPVFCKEQVEYFVLTRSLLRRLIIVGNTREWHNVARREVEVMVVFYEFLVWSLFYICYIHITSMAKCKTAVSPMLTHWRYHSLTLNHRYVVSCSEKPYYEDILKNIKHTIYNYHSVLCFYLFNSF